MPLLRRSERPGSEYFTGCHNAIRRLTTNVQRGGLRADWDRLSDREAAELVELTRRTDEQGRADGLVLSRLGGDLGRWEKLVEKAADAPGIFARKRDLWDLERDIRQMTKDVLKRPFTRREEKRLLGEIGDHFRGRFLGVEHMALLVVLLTAFDSGEPPGPFARFEAGEGGDPVLVATRGRALVAGACDEEGMLAGWASRHVVGHLERNGWVTLAANGNELRIGLGPRTRRLLLEAK